MNEFHGLTSDAVAKYTSNTIATTRHCCPYCGIQYSNLYSHKKHCKINVTSIAVATTQTLPHVLRGRNAEEMAIVQAYKAWIQTQKLSAAYSIQIMAKTERLIKFWEETVEDFKGYKLLDPFKEKIMLPSLDEYLANATTVGDKRIAVNAYLHLCDFIICQFDRRYGSKAKISLRRRISYKAGIQGTRVKKAEKTKLTTTT